MVEISVIIPAYNVGQYIDKCLDSVINQTFEDIEIICIDDGSTDNTLDIIKSYAKDDNRIKFIHQENRGLSASRNVGLNNSKGKYICFLDSDDFLDLDALKKTYDICEDKNLDFLIYKLIDFDDETDQCSPNSYFDIPFLKDMVGGDVFNHEDVGWKVYQMCVTAPGKLFKYDLIRDIRFPEGLIFEDNIFFTDVMFKAERVYFLDEYLYYRRVRQDSITNSSTDRFKDWIEINNLLIDVTKKHGQYDKYKWVLFNKKIFNSYKNFSRVKEDEKEEFFELLKADFKNHRDEYESDEVFKGLREREKLIFRTGIDALTYREFELTIQNFDLNNSNENLSKDNSDLKKRIISYKKINHDILNSNSWKLTKPLRKSLNIFRK